MENENKRLLRRKNLLIKDEKNSVQLEKIYLNYIWNIYRVLLYIFTGWNHTFDSLNKLTVLKKVFLVSQTCVQSYKLLLLPRGVILLLIGCRQSRINNNK